MPRRINRHSPGCGCCGPEDDDEPPDDPCNPGTPLTPYIWFDHDIDGTFEDGPYAMVYDAAEAIWTYNVVVTRAGYDATCAVSSSGTLSMWFTMNLGSGTTRYLACYLWHCCCFPQPCLRPRHGIYTAPTFTGNGTIGAPNVSPLPDCSLGSPTEGYSFSLIETLTDPCNNRVLFYPSIPFGHTHPAVVITRSNTSSGP